MCGVGTRAGQSGITRRIRRRVIKSGDRLGLVRLPFAKTKTLDTNTPIDGNQICKPSSTPNSISTPAAKSSIPSFDRGP